MKIHFRPKTKMAETIKNSHFRRRKRKRISVGLYLRLRLTTVEPALAYSHGLDLDWVWAEIWWPPPPRNLPAATPESPHYTHVPKATSAYRIQGGSVYGQRIGRCHLVLTTMQ